MAQNVSRQTTISLQRIKWSIPQIYLIWSSCIIITLSDLAEVTLILFSVGSTSYDPQTEKSLHYDLSPPLPSLQTASPFLRINAQINPELNTQNRDCKSTPQRGPFLCPPLLPPVLLCRYTLPWPANSHHPPSLALVSCHSTPDHTTG